MASLHLAQQIYDLIYPVGAVYISTSSTSPASLFGGTWTQITSRFLYCTTTSKTTGGSTTHTHTLSRAGGANIRKYSDTFWQGETSTAGAFSKQSTDSAYWCTTANADYQQTSTPSETSKVTRYWVIW
jgi:hypothetical protein